MAAELTPLVPPRPVPYAFDRATIGYAAAGALLSANGLSWLPVLGIAVGWQLLEGTLRNYVAFLPREKHDTRQRQVLDVGTMMLAWWLTSKLPTTEPERAPAR